MVVETYRQLMVGEFILGVLGLMHFAIVYTYFEQYVMRGFIVSTLIVLTAIILYIITEHHARKAHAKR